MNKFRIFFVVILSFTLISSVNSFGTQCSQFIEQSFYNMRELYIKHDHSLKVNDEQTLYWNFCEILEHRCNDEHAYAAIWYDDGEVQDSFNTVDLPCKSLSDEQYWTFTWSLLGEKQPELGFQVKMVGGFDELDITFRLHCNQTANLTSEMISLAFGTHYIYEAQTKFSCPVYTIPRYWEFIEDNQQFFAIFLILFGIAFNYFGVHLKNFVLFISGFALGSMVCMLILISLFVQYDTPDSTIWVFLWLSLIQGFQVGKYVVGKQNYGFFVLGCFAGYFLGLFLYNVIFFRWDDPLQNYWVYWTTLACSIAIVAGLAKKMRKQIAIGATVTIGSVSICKGLSMLFGITIEQQSAVQKLTQGETDFNTLYWIYIVLQIGTFVTGLYYQEAHRRKRFIWRIVDKKYELKIIKREKKAKEFDDDDETSNHSSNYIELKDVKNTTSTQSLKVVEKK